MNSAIEMIHFRVAPDSNSYRVCTLDQLDRIPTPTKIVKPLYSREKGHGFHEGHITVGFYIDEKGHVRLPAVSRESDEELSAAAIMAVEQWQFEPPVSRGQPVVVRAEQTFDFKAPAH
jgi:TonB family protein